MMFVERHYKKIFIESNKIKKDSQYLSNAEFFHNLYGFYLRDIEDNAEKICGEAIDYCTLNSLKLNPDKLETNIVDRLLETVPNYERIASGYLMGGMRQEYRKFEEDKQNFKTEAEELIRRTGRVLSGQYRDSIKKELRSIWTLRLTIIGIVVAIAVALFEHFEHKGNEKHEKTYDLVQATFHHLST